MMYKISIKIKAFLLLLVFSLNTLVGLACSIGVDMGFNSAIHHQHHHEENEETTHPDCGELKHDTVEEDNDHDNICHDLCSIEEGNIKSTCFRDLDEKGNCCNNNVVKFVRLDKSIVHYTNLICPVFATSFLSVFYYINVLKFLDGYSTTKYFVRGHHPPIANIRIAIQSFQI